MHNPQKIVRAASKGRFLRVDRFMRYGVPYKGSKNKIAKWVIEQLPEADTFVDLFAGGCAVTHAALESGKYKHIIANDIEGSGIQLFIDAINGKYKDERRWISREDFFRLKDTDPYVKWCWSFGNNGKQYLYGADIEEYKRTIHEICFAETPHDRRMAYRKAMRWLYDKGYLTTRERANHAGDLESLQSLESLERLQRIERLDYRDVIIPDNAVVYCDIPYKGTNDYGMEFDHNAFYEWARNHPCYVSEYQMPDDFTCVASKESRCTFASINNSKKVTERIFTCTQ